MVLQLRGRLGDEDRSFVRDYCPIERTLDLVGSKSALLLLREAAYGTTRFDDFAARVGLSDVVVSARLRELVQAGCLMKRPYRDPGQRTRDEYVITQAGLDLVPALLVMAEWGSTHLPQWYGPSFSHVGCGAPIVPSVRCAEGHEVGFGDVVVSG